MDSHKPSHPEQDNRIPTGEEGKPGTDKIESQREARIASTAQGVSGFVESLVNKGIVSRKMVNDALTRKKLQGDTDKRRLFQILIEDFAADRERVYDEFARYYSFKRIDLSALGIDGDKLLFINRTLEQLPQRLRESATANKVLPLQVAEGDPSKLQVITPNPANADISQIARGFPYSKYEIYYVPSNDFEELARQLIVEQQSRPSEKSVDYIDEDQQNVIDELEEEIRKGHLGELVDNLLADAVRINASDLHVIPRAARKTEVHFRIDGHLTLWQTIDDLRADAVSAVIKDVAKGTDRFERNMAQDGFIQKTIDNKIVRFRVSIIPMVGKELRVKFESIVIRVLRDPEASITVDNIGFQPEALERFKKAIDKPYGIVILTGPTGSGKSTTLLAAIRAVMDPTLNVITVEDPVEYFIDGARQVKLNPKLDFEGALRAILRHDPDIVMVGEIRDKTTADMAIKLANTGHLTFSTLHTNDAPSAIARLYKMGLEPFLLAYSLNIIVAQRLLRKLCDRCKLVDREVLPISLEKLGYPKADIESTVFFRPVGCIHCHGGYKGRIAIHEVLYFTPEIRRLILEAGNTINEGAIRQTAMQEGMKTLRDAAFDLLRKGITTTEEVAGTTTED